MDDSTAVSLPTVHTTVHTTNNPALPLTTLTLLLLLLTGTAGWLAIKRR